MMGAQPKCLIPTQMQISHSTHAAQLSPLRCLLEAVLPVFPWGRLQLSTQQPFSGLLCIPWEHGSHNLADKAR